MVVTGDYCCLPIDEVKAWKDIVAISADGTVVAGLKSDGTVVAATTTIEGEQPFITPDWTDIVDVAVGTAHILSLIHI